MEMKMFESSTLNSMWQKLLSPTSRKFAGTRISSADRWLKVSSFHHYVVCLGVNKESHEFLIGTAEFGFK